MNKSLRNFVLALCSLTFCTFSMCAQSVAKTEIVVSAAASTKDALTQIAQDFTKSKPNVDVRFNFGASGALQTQIEQGAPVDVFVSAARKNMDALQTQKLIETSTRRIVARNALVLVVPTSSTRLLSTRNQIRSFGDLARADVKNVAIGAPASVPAGKYAQQVLTKIGVWKSVVGKAVQMRDVREVLAQVELGNVAAGIVYRSDAASSRRVRVVATAPATFHDAIRYDAAVVRDSRNQIAARSFVRFLTSAKARSVFVKLKFSAP